MTGFSDQLVAPRDANWAKEFPPTRRVSATEIRAHLSGARRLVVLDDDPTGTQTVRDVPVLTRWHVEDVRWALRQGTPGFYVLTNTRSLSPVAAAERNRDVAEACLEAARLEDVQLTFASRGDSTLRGHFPLETDVLAEVLAEHGQHTDAVLLAPAYIDAGRVTVDGVHWAAGPAGLAPIADGEYARDATFGYRSSRLAEWVEEKSDGRLRAAQVAEVHLTDIRTAGSEALRAVLSAARDGQVVAIDAATDDDLRSAVLDIIAAEHAGVGIVQRVGPSFVRARLGQEDGSRIDDERLAQLVDPDAHGLVVVGSHVALTTRQLEVLRQRRSCVELELDVAKVMDPADRASHVEQLVRQAVTGLADNLVVLRTSRQLVTGIDANGSLDIARTVSSALVDATARIVGQRRPSYVVAKGGITSSDVATHALRMDRAWIRGPILDGIVSLWEAASGFAADLPYVVFAGNVGDDNSLADVVERLEKASGRSEIPA
jgi:uncharacterized protein YgbK (DUF1537 family)